MENHLPLLTRTSIADHAVNNDIVHCPVHVLPGCQDVDIVQE